MASASEGDSHRVLYVDPDEAAAEPTIAALEDTGLTVDWAQDAAGAHDHLTQAACVVSRHRLPHESGLALLRTVRDRHPDRPFVLFTDEGDENLASDAIAAGVTEYVPSRSGPALHRSVVECVERALSGQVAADAGIDETLKDQAMDEAPIGITVADAAGPGTPMVYINDSFQELTGYDREDVLGWNCRFLQGPRSDREALDQMRAAIDNGEEVSVELVNYDADGEAFWNRVDIAPLYDDGELTHFVGFQTDVTERVEAERVARRQAARAQRERETVESLLEHLNGVVADVTATLIEAGTRHAAESQVCERLVDSDQYTMAGVADIEPGSDSAWAEVVAGPDGALAEAEFSLVDDGPIARAIQRGEPVFAEAPPAGWPMLGDPFADRPLGAIPLQYGDATFGVLVVVAQDEVFDEHERGILGAIGNVMATALNAITTQQRLHSDEVIECEFALGGREPFIVSLSGKLSCRFDLVGTVAGEHEYTGLFFETSDTTYEAIEAALTDHGTDITCRLIASDERRSVVEFDLGESALVQTLRDHGANLQSLWSENGTGELVIDIDRESEPRRVVEAIERQIAGAELSAFRDRERPARTRGEFLEAINQQLTDRQATALRKAHVGGFFEWPRRTTGEELAESMGIDNSTFHQHLRVAQDKVLGTLFEM
ncbi:MAG: bacterio-opsin activator domain-containing protein [Halobacteriales archaeon]